MTRLTVRTTAFSRRSSAESGMEAWFLVIFEKQRNFGKRDSYVYWISANRTETKQTRDRRLVFFFKSDYILAKMSCTSELSKSREYQSFRSSVPLRKIVVDIDGAKASIIRDWISHFFHSSLFFVELVELISFRRKGICSRSLRDWAPSTWPFNG